MKTKDQGVVINIEAPRPTNGSRHCKKEEEILRDKVADLEETLNAKDDTIQELSEFMNEQATRLA